MGSSPNRANSKGNYISHPSKKLNVTSEVMRLAIELPKQSVIL